ncbi:DUF72 domain-containing protein [Chryseolinea lacunae]|uniref:DUF72 domain-containing protein n=1 Tax=Chryseolinea lacunae TaxID=2801331 RepID=A0ABS1KZ63_9BACT|nr:DUF72 domain-containing protein [Chryseolinea lacunae]MBL0744745.1 DUF72 domain-containing protein [Chryseolinea lacunae]
MSGKLMIGTSGVVVPGTKQTFPEAFKEGSRLQYYSSLFNSLEVNSSFYRVPMHGTFEKWEKEVTDDFEFTMKLWRNVTHVKALAFNKADIDSFMRAVNGVHHKKGCVLVQFPASITFAQLRQVKKILHHLDRANLKSAWRIAVEFRDVSWYTDKTYDMLETYNACLVEHDMPKSKTPAVDLPVRTAYLRFHGMYGDYKGSYSNEDLNACARRIAAWRDAGKDVYVYFNNTIGGAFENAQRLKEKLGSVGC